MAPNGQLEKEREAAEDQEDHAPSPQPTPPYLSQYTLYTYVTRYYKKRHTLHNNLIT